MRKVPCPSCNGRKTDRFRRPCPQCGGSLDPRRLGRGWVWADNYTGQEVGAEDTRTTRREARERTRPCDSCGGNGAYGNGRRCRWCDGSGVRVVTASSRDSDKRDRGDDLDDALTVALQATHMDATVSLWRLGSFAAMDKAIATLPPYGRRLIGRADPDPDEKEELARLVRWLDREIRRLDGRVRVPSECREAYAAFKDGRRPAARGTGRWANPWQQGERNTEIRRLHSEDGLTGKQIARRLGLNASTVSRVLAAA